MRYTTIGLEIHLKLNTETKMFCRCKNEQNFDNLLPNTNICPTCTAQPGALPILTQETVNKAMLLGKILNCTINEISRFDRKSYFYPDIPTGYQITQFYQPINTKGKISFFLDNYTKEKEIHILEAHMESDTAKMIHNEGQALLDFNRAGTPLVEIVTGPDFTNADEVIEFLKELQRRAKFNNISDADLEKGQMRVDVNISLRKSENDPYGTRVEMKNINSYGAIKRAIENETSRQQKIYDANDTFTQQTRGRNDIKGESYLMRSKEDALDYRYFPEPDLPPLKLSQEQIQNIHNQEIILPYEIIKNLKENFGFHKEYINALIQDQSILNYFTKLIAKGFDPKITAKWISGPIAARLNTSFKSINELPCNSEYIEQFLTKAQEGKLLENQLKEIMEEMLQTTKDCETIIKEKGFDAPTIDTNEIEAIIKEVLEANPTIVEQYKGGKTTTLGFFLGQVMKKTGGKLNPKEVGPMIEAQLQ